MTQIVDTDAEEPCPRCGASNPGDANFCHNCGIALGAVTESSVAQRPTTSLIHVVACATDIGKRHHVNQDAGGAWTWTRSGGTPASLLVVADGVSAGRQSEEASRLTVELIVERLQPLLSEGSLGADALLGELLSVAREANHRVSERPHQALANADSTTLVAALCVGREGRGIWLGDSRAYLFSPSGVERLTRDHSWAESVVSSGIMTEEQAARDSRARMITRWLGPPDEEDPGLETFSFVLAAGTGILCCTDGLYMYFGSPDSDEAEMGRVLNSHGNLQAAVDQLVAIALERGGHDNITAAAIRNSATEQS